MKWEKGDIIQIDPEKDDMFGGCFMVVTEEKPWGAQGYVRIPGQEGLAFKRTIYEKGMKVGHAEWIYEWEEDDD